MLTEDRKLAWAGVLVFAVLAAEIGWFLFVGPAERGTGNPADHTGYYYLLPWHWDAAGWTACFTFFLTLSTGLLWLQTKRLAIGAEKQSTFVRRDYEATHRPWIQIMPLIATNPLRFTDEGVSIELMFSYKNVGRGIADRITTRVIGKLTGSALLAMRSSVDDLISEMRKTETPTNFGDVLFPNDESPQPATIKFTREELDTAAKAFTDFDPKVDPPLIAFVFVCSNYYDKVSEEPRCTANTYMLALRPGPAEPPGTFGAIIGGRKEIPREEIVFPRLPMGSRIE